MYRLFSHFSFLVCLMAILLWADSAAAQYARGNSPYSRYGFGDLHGNMLLPNQTMSGGMAATYRSFWNVNLVNPAAFGKLHLTSFQLGINYEHHALSEKATGLKAQADNGNLSYISLAFPITKSWEVVRDTLRRGAPVQWGMGFALMPFSARSYDVTVLRDVGNVPNVEFNYTGKGTRYKVNWGNGVTYKGISAGANIGLMFGKMSNTTGIDFQDSSYVFAYDETFIEEENGVGFIWDVGVQYELKLKDKSRVSSNDPTIDVGKKITFGAYAGSVAPIKTFTTQVYTRGSASFNLLDSIRSVSDVQGQITMPMKIGGGVSYGKEASLQFGVSFESQLWSMYRVNGQADENIRDSWRVAAGAQWIPDFADYSNYANRIHYRAGLHYGTDPRSLLAENGTRYQLMNYGLSLGAGFPVRPPKEKTMTGFVNLGFDVGYMGHPELIGDVYFRINLGFALNASGWFAQSKYR